MRAVSKLEAEASLDSVLQSADGDTFLIEDGGRKLAVLPPFEAYEEEKRRREAARRRAAIMEEMASEIQRRAALGEFSLDELGRSLDRKNID